jgi:signal transduction histidine kinase
MQAALRMDRDAFRHRLLVVLGWTLAIGGSLVPIAVATLVDPSPAAWAPYLAAPLGCTIALALEQNGRRSWAVALVAGLTTLLTAQSGVRDATSFGNALYMLPVTLFVLAFVDTQRARRALLVGAFCVVVAQRVLRGLVALDVSPDAWFEGTFHSIAIFVAFGILMDVLHRIQSRDQRALELAYDDVVVARAQADAEAAAALHSSRTTSHFLEAMSHELRTPLNAVVGYAELLLEDDPTETAQGDLTRIRDAGTHMVGLVDEVLDVSKVESGRLQRERGLVDVRKLLAATANLARPLLRPGVELVVDVPASVGTVVSDQQKLRQILLNLLSNAARFTHTGQVRLTASRSATHLCLTVQDTGIGMDPAQVDRMFEAFAQADHRQGTGLGLALCTRFAELLGGSITVDTSPGRGSSFRLSVPIEPTNLDEPTEEGSAPLHTSYVGLPPSRRREEARAWLSIGTGIGAVFGVVTAALVAQGSLSSQLGPELYVALVFACMGAWALAQRGALKTSLAVFVLAALAVDAHSHVFHPHAQASVLYLCVLALYVSIVLPPRWVPSVLGVGGLAALGMVGLRYTQRLDSTEAFVSIAVDTILIYGASALALGMVVRRHEHEEHALAEATFDLDRLRAQAKALAQAARAANGAKASFLAAMSHELRSPLTAIIGYAELLDDELPPDDEGRGDVQAIGRAARTLLALINEVLDLARVQAGGMPVDPELLGLHDLVRARSAQARGQGVALVDRHLFDRVVDLLVERGATTFVVQRGGLTTELPASRPYVPSVFEPFSPDPTLGRPGAGWALLQELCDTMHGTLAIEDADGTWHVQLTFPTSP